MLWIYRKLRMVRQALCSKDSPRQLAAGIACGVVLGLVPKGNLVALAVAALLLATRMSLATGLLSATLFSLVAPWCDPLTSRLGHWVLTNAALSPLWRTLYQVPLAAWTSFHNTVVMGSLSLGLALTYPVYRLTLPWMELLHRRYAEAEPEAEPDSLKSEEGVATPDQPASDTLKAPKTPELESPAADSYPLEPPEPVQQPAAARETEPETEPTEPDSLETTEPETTEPETEPDSLEFLESSGRDPSGGPSCNGRAMSSAAAPLVPRRSDSHQRRRCA